MPLYPYIQNSHFWEQFERTWDFGATGLQDKLPSTDRRLKTGWASRLLKFTRVFWIYDYFVFEKNTKIGDIERWPFGVSWGKNIVVRSLKLPLIFGGFWSTPWGPRPWFDKTQKSNRSAGSALLRLNFDRPCPTKWTILVPANESMFQHLGVSGCAQESIFCSVFSCDKMSMSSWKDISFHAVDEHRYVIRKMYLYFQSLSRWWFQLLYSISQFSILFGEDSHFD